MDLPPSSFTIGRCTHGHHTVLISFNAGQAVFYTCACPTERGTCLEITLQSEGVKGRNSCSSGEASAGGGIAEVPTILSLYATHAHFRPTRLSSYSWISRGKTFHRLLLNWKGRPELPVPENGTNQANSQPEPSGSHPAPIHIAIVCPESVPSPDPSASTDDESGTERAKMTRGASKDVASSAPSRFRVAYTLGVREIGPPRVVLEGRCVRQEHACRSLLFFSSTGVSSYRRVTPRSDQNNHRE